MEPNMSNVSNRHDIVKFVAGKSVPLSGQRLAKVRYNTNKKTKEAPKYPSVCVSVPKIQDTDIQENMDSLIPHVRDMLEKAQDGIVKSLYESKEGKLDVVTDTDISVVACIEYLDSLAAGDRLKKETVEKWFDAIVAESCYVILAEKLGFTPGENGLLNEDQNKVVKGHVEAYKDRISSIPSGKVILNPGEIKSCRFMIETAVSTGDDSENEDGDSISQKLLNVLEQMEKPKVQKELLILI
jgi:hypothetical protein